MIIITPKQPRRNRKKPTKYVDSTEHTHQHSHNNGHTLEHDHKHPEITAWMFAHSHPHVHKVKWNKANTKAMKFAGQIEAVKATAKEDTM